MWQLRGNPDASKREKFIGVVLKESVFMWPKNMPRMLPTEDHYPDKDYMLRHRLDNTGAILP